MIEVKSAFLYRGKFDDYAAAFERKTEVAYAVPFATPQDVAVIMSKQWFSWADETKPLTPGTTLVFKTTSAYAYQTKDVYRSIEVEGSARPADELPGEAASKALVATIEYISDGPTRGNPVLDFLARMGTPVGLPEPFAQPYTLGGAGGPINSFVTPASNQAYSTVSGDVNPIHCNP